MSGVRQGMMTKHLFSSSCLSYLFSAMARLFWILSFSQSEFSKLSTIFKDTEGKLCNHDIYFVSAL